MFASLFRATMLSPLFCSIFVAGAVQAETKALSEPLVVVVGYAPGGATDHAARIIAEGLQGKLGVPVIVENKTGAGGRIAAQYVKAAGPEKNILALANPAVMVVAPLVFQKLAYDPVKDFRPVSMATQYGFGVAVPAQSTIKDLQGLIALAKENPSKFNVGVPATGSLPHFFGLMLADKIGVKTEIVGYRGSAPVLTDLIGGIIPVAIDTLDVLGQQHDAGRIRILATSGAEREHALPKVPTFIESGIALDAFGWNAFFASSSMPEAKAEMLGKAIKDVLSDSRIQQSLLKSDLIPVVADAQQTSTLVKDFRQKWEPVIRDSKFVVTE